MPHHGLKSGVMSTGRPILMSASFWEASLATSSQSDVSWPSHSKQPTRSSTVSGWQLVQALIVCMHALIAGVRDSIAKTMAESSQVCKKRSYDAAFKLKVIEFAEQNANRGAARKYGIDEKRVREWKKQKDQLGSLNSKKRRLDGGGRKAALPDMEEEVVTWIESLRAQNLRVTRSNVQVRLLNSLKLEENELVPC